jgi:hypothetical protein
MTVSTRSPGPMTSTRWEERTRGPTVAGEVARGAGLAGAGETVAALGLASSDRPVTGPASRSTAMVKRSRLIRPSPRS